MRRRLIGFRLSDRDRDELRERALEAGMTVQAYLEWKALDRAHPQVLRSGRPKSTQDRLPMTG